MSDVQATGFGGWIERLMWRNYIILETFWNREKQYTEAVIEAARSASNWCTLETVKDTYEFQSRHSIRELVFLFLQQIGDLLLALFPTSVVHGMIFWSRWIIVCLSWGCLTEEITQILKDKIREHICVQLNDGNSCYSHWCQLRFLCRQRVTHTIIITMKQFKNVKNILEDILVAFLVSSQRKKLNYCKVYPNWTCK